MQLPFGKFGWWFVAADFTSAVELIRKKFDWCSIIEGRGEAQ